MKKIIVLSFIALSNSVWAYSTPIMRPAGTYTYQGVEVLQVRENEVVPQLNMDRVYELIADQYNCYPRAQFFLCQKHVENVDLPAHLEKQVDAAWNGKQFVFNLSGLSPQQTNESESLLEWDILDSVTFGTETAPKYQYYILRGNPAVHKLSIHFPSLNQWFFVENVNLLKGHLQKVERLDNFRSRIFELHLKFSR